MQNMQDVVEKYYGMIHWEGKNCVFSLQVMVPDIEKSAFHTKKNAFHTIALEKCKMSRYNENERLVCTKEDANGNDFNRFL